MFDPKEESTKNLIEKYKTLFKMAMKEYDKTPLSIDQLKAVGRRVLDECMETAFNNQNIPSEDRPEIMKQFEELLRTECPDMMFDTPLKFDGKKFIKEE